MIYIIDHQDSFTWNVVHQFSKFDEVYCSNYFEIDQKKLDQSNTIILSPGPGSPKDYPYTSKIYKKYKGKKKIIGICLGYQQILFNETGRGDPTQVSGLRYRDLRIGEKLSGARHLVSPPRGAASGVGTPPSRVRVVHWS